MEENFSKLVNLLWQQCIENLNNYLEEDERGKFSNNDYYYLLMIQSMEQLNLSEIAQKLNMTKPAITAMIRKLQKMNLVEKIQSQSDKRVHHVRLTAKGNNILSGDRAIYRWVTDTMSTLCPSHKEKEMLEYLIKQLVQHLEAKLYDHR